MCKAVHMFLLALAFSVASASESCEGSSLLQASSHLHEQIGPTDIPCVIHQIFNGTYDQMAEPKASYVQTWRMKNPKCEHRLWRDTDIEELVMTKAQDTLAPIWAALSPGERANSFRYLVLYDQGGYFAELRVSCEKPIAEYEVPRDAKMLVGYEFGHRWSEKQRIQVNFARTEQFANYFLASAPGNPVLGRVLNMIRERFSWKIQSNDLTGSATLSDAVHEFLEVASPDAVEKENYVRKHPPSVHFVSYASENLYEFGRWKLWLFAAGRINAAPQVARDDPDEALPSLVKRHFPETK